MEWKKNNIYSVLYMSDDSDDEKSIENDIQPKQKTNNIYKCNSYKKKIFCHKSYKNTNNISHIYDNNKNILNIINNNKKICKL